MLDVLAIVLNDSQILIHLIIIAPYKHCYYLHIIDEKTEAQRSSNVFRVSQLVSAGARIQTQAPWLQNPWKHLSYI